MANTANETGAGSSNAQVHIYHCLCTQLVLATTTAIDLLPRRKVDDSSIATAGGTVLEQRLSTDQTPLVVRLEDGFEKRYLVRCSRCGLTVGYHLDKSQFDRTVDEPGPNMDVSFMLPGGLMETDEMVSGKKIDPETGLLAPR